MLIKVKNFKLKTVIGVYEWEKTVQRDLIFNVEIETPNIDATLSDNLSDTVDYDEIVAAITKIGSQKFDLIEKMAGELSKKIMLNQKISSCTIEIDKMGIIKEADSCSVTIKTKRK